MCPPSEQRIHLCLPLSVCLLLAGTSVCTISPHRHPHTYALHCTGDGYVCVCVCVWASRGMATPARLNWYGQIDGDGSADVCVCVWGGM
mmetsp:Transcript_5914/g.16814  ORF Transcript_5914/g.16814 Transcript_5914/m.16814 type:complete len:89 (+) Transcript_5914:172-438(+)